MPKNPLETLPVPPAALKDRKAREMIRAWVAANGLHCSLNVGMWHDLQTAEERWAWGILLADVVRHIANALEEQFGMDRRKTINLIRESFQTELDHPTSEAKGSLVEPIKKRNK